MSLGSDQTVCQTEFVEAMRARLEAEQPGLGDNVDEASVQANLGALGQAVFRIATVQAETTSDAATDAAFWQWVAEANTWLASLALWQQAVANAFQAWVPTQPAEQTLKANLTAAPNPGPPPASPPASLRGRIE